MVEFDEALGNVVGVGCSFRCRDSPVAGPYIVQAPLEHVADFRLAIDSLDIPGKSDEITPVPVFGEQLHRVIYLVVGQRPIEGGQAVLDLGFGSLIEHAIPPKAIVAPRRGGLVDLATPSNRR